MSRKPFRRATRIAAGSGLILVGIPMLVLPGPGLLTIFAGLTVVASEFAWADRIVTQIRDKAARIRSEDERPSEYAPSEDQTG